MEWASLRRRGEDVEEEDDDPDSTSGMFGMIANAKLASAKLASAAGTMLDSEKMENARRNVFNLDGSAVFGASRAVLFLENLSLSALSCGGTILCVINS